MLLSPQMTCQSPSLLHDSNWSFSAEYLKTSENKTIYNKYDFFYFFFLNLQATEPKWD